jgi:hypothetical protein
LGLRTAIVIWAVGGAALLVVASIAVMKRHGLAALAAALLAGAGLLLVVSLPPVVKEATTTSPVDGWPVFCDKPIVSGSNAALDGSDPAITACHSVIDDRLRLSGALLAAAGGLAVAAVVTGRIARRRERSVREPLPSLRPLGRAHTDRSTA